MRHIRGFFATIAEMWRERNRVYDCYRWRNKRQDEKLYYKAYGGLRRLAALIAPVVRGYG